MDRALLVGINKYPGAELSGCVNDVTDMANFLVDRCAFRERDIRLITDGRATTSAIHERLAWLVKGAKAGDRLFFHYSGHGAQYPDRNGGEVDGLDEVICPVDFDWSVERMIRDKQLHEIFKPVPRRVEFVWVSDSCHSADLSRDMVRPRSIPQPADIAWRAQTARAKKLSHGTLAPPSDLNVALISGCESNQTSADASFGDRANGALTHYLLRALQAPHGLKEPLVDLVPTVRSALRNAGYSQRPQLEGSASISGRAFLQAAAAPAGHRRPRRRAK